MDLTQLANLGEFIGGVAVLVTLIYLALQVKQNTNTVRASTVQSLQDSASSFVTSIALDEEVTALWLRGLQGADLNTTQSARVSLLLHAAFRRYENAFLQFRLGVIDETNWKPWEKLIGANMSMAGPRQWWEQARIMYSDEFAQFVGAIEPAEGRGGPIYSAVRGMSDSDAGGA